MEGIKKEMDVLRKALLEDKDYYYSWQANIAVCFQDEFYRQHKHKGVHKISNEAAKNFLNLLIGDFKTA